MKQKLNFDVEYRKVRQLLVTQKLFYHILWLTSCILLMRIFQIREKTQYGSPWRQTPRSRVSPDTEVSQIMTPRAGLGARPKTPLKGVARSGLLSPGTRPGLVSPGMYICFDHYSTGVIHFVSVGLPKCLCFNNSKV